MEAKNNKDIYETKIIDCICCWYDLLGYGAPFIEAKWDLNDERCQKNAERLSSIYNYFRGNLLNACPGITKLSFNDGAICNIDIDYSENNLRQVVRFLDAVFSDYQTLNFYDQKHENPGVRGVLTAGQRFQCDSFDSSYDLKSKRTVEFTPHVFQMNTAFSKAYIMEESGRAHGVAGANLYVDEELFKYLDRLFRISSDYSLCYCEESDALIVKILCRELSLLSISLDRKKIPYKYKGIETNLFRLIDVESYYDELARAAAHMEAQRYSKIEEQSEDDW